MEDKGDCTSPHLHPSNMQSEVQNRGRDWNGMGDQKDGLTSEVTLCMQSDCSLVLKWQCLVSLLCADLVLYCVLQQERDRVRTVHHKVC